MELRWTVCWIHWKWQGPTKVHRNPLENQWECKVLLTGHYPSCHTLYTADHENVPQSKGDKKCTSVYLNSALYLKVGQSLWVDRIF